MTEFLVRRLVQSVFVLLGVSVLVFVMLFIVGDPAVVLLPPETSLADLERFRHAMGFDRPFHEQYWDFVSRAVRGDFGESLWYRQPAGSLVLERLPATFQLAIAGMTIAVSLGLPLGVAAAARRGSLVDYVAGVFAVLGQSMPIYWLGLLLVLLLTVNLHALPSSGTGTFSHLVMPALTLGLYSTARVMRLTRSGMLDVLSQDYIRTARSKGLHSRVVLTRHALRNALVPIVTYLGLETGNLLGGAVVVETIFAWPGVGRLAVDAIDTRDYILLQAIVAIVATTFVVVNLAVDLLYPLLDPRIRLARRRT
jgi:peptide/nickel transport system permease protein